MSPRPFALLVLLGIAGCGAKTNGESPGTGTGTGTVRGTGSGTTAGTGTGASGVAPTAEAPATAAAASATATASAVATGSAEAPAAPPPDVEVKNIGMHIGGGPNDAVTKGPIKRSVEPHMGELAACFGKAEDQEKGGDVSVDLRIEAAGGKAELKKYKSAIAGAPFRACVEQVFLAIEFEKPKTGATVVSYSLRFSPKKK